MFAGVLDVAGPANEPPTRPPGLPPRRSPAGAGCCWPRPGERCACATSFFQPPQPRPNPPSRGTPRGRFIFQAGSKATYGQLPSLSYLPHHWARPHPARRGPRFTAGLLPAPGLPTATPPAQPQLPKKARPRRENAPSIDRIGVGPGEPVTGHGQGSSPRCLPHKADVVLVPVLAPRPPGTRRGAAGEIRVGFSGPPRKPSQCRAPDDQPRELTSPGGPIRPAGVFALNDTGERHPGPGPAWHAAPRPSGGPEEFARAPANGRVFGNPWRPDLASILPRSS